MKKLIAALLAALTMSFGLVGISGASSQAVAPQAAACDEPSCYTTNLTLFIRRPEVRGARALILVRVRTEHWITPTGKITLTIEKVNGGLNYNKVVTYGGGARRINGPHFRSRGLYYVTATFNSGGRFGSSTVTKVMKIV